MTDPDVIRGIERVTGERYDPESDTWQPADPEVPALIVHAGVACASAGASGETNPEDSED